MGDFSSTSRYPQRDLKLSLTFALLGQNIRYSIKNFLTINVLFISYSKLGEQFRNIKVYMKFAFSLLI